MRQFKSKQLFCNPSLHPPCNKPLLRQRWLRQAWEVSVSLRLGSGNRTSATSCEAQWNTEVLGSLVNIKNFKTVMSEHYTKPGAFLSQRPRVTAGVTWPWGWSSFGIPGERQKLSDCFLVKEKKRCMYYIYRESRRNISPLYLCNVWSFWCILFPPQEEAFGMAHAWTWRQAVWGSFPPVRWSFQAGSAEAHWAACLNSILTLCEDGVIQLIQKHLESISLLKTT